MKYGDPLYYFVIQANEIELVISDTVQIGLDEDCQTEYKNIIKKINNSEALIHYLMSDKTMYIVSEDENYLHIFRNGIQFILENLKVILETQ